MGVSLLNFFYLKPLNTSKQALNTNHPFFWDTLYISTVPLCYITDLLIVKQVHGHSLIEGELLDALPTSERFLKIRYRLYEIQGGIISRLRQDSVFRLVPVLTSFTVRPPLSSKWRFLYVNNSCRKSSTSLVT